MVNVTLIATFYSTEPFMTAAYTFYPTIKKIILIVDTLDSEVKSNIKAVEKTFGSRAKVRSSGWRRMISTTRPARP